MTTDKMRKLADDTLISFVDFVSLERVRKLVLILHSAADRIDELERRVDLLVEERLYSGEN